MTDYRLWPATNGPAVEADTSSTDLGVQFKVTSGSAITFNGYWRWSGTGQDTNGTHYSFKLFSTANGTTGSLVTGTSVTGAGTWTVGSWYYTPLSVPVTLVSGTTYVASVTHTTAANHYPATASYWSSGAGSAGITNGPLIAPGVATALGGIQSGYNEPSTGVIPSHVYNATNYWIDVSVTIADAVNANAGQATSSATAYNAAIAVTIDASSAQVGITGNDAIGSLGPRSNQAISSTVSYAVARLDSSLSTADTVECDDNQPVILVVGGGTDTGSGVDASQDNEIVATDEMVGIEDGNSDYGVKYPNDAEVMTANEAAGRLLADDDQARLKSVSRAVYRER